jgi:bifunctional non-homologous end joining protein LigD
LEATSFLDGELVALDSQGRPSFQLLQNSLSQSLPIYFYAFDLLNRNGGLLVNLPLHELLENLLAVPEEPMRLSPVTVARSPVFSSRLSVFDKLSPP